MSVPCRQPTGRLSWGHYGPLKLAGQGTAPDGFSLTDDNNQQF
ncbi:MAG: hypothetical protein WC869_04355 [Phycisphaerae bacterium]